MSLPPEKVAGINLGNWARYPKEYDRSIHGRYDPATYYGKPDTRFLDVKLSDLSAWIGRREKSPARFFQMIGRAYWRWQHAYVLPRKSGVAPFFQVAMGAMVLFYFINYPRIRIHRTAKYH